MQSNEDYFIGVVAVWVVLVIIVIMIAIGVHFSRDRTKLEEQDEPETQTPKPDDDPPGLRYRLSSGELVEPGLSTNPRVRVTPSKPEPRVRQEHAERRVSASLHPFCTTFWERDSSSLQWTCSSFLFRELRR